MTGTPAGLVKVLTLTILIAAAGLQSASADNILVFGGTGRLGSEIVKQLSQAGADKITVFARPTSDRSRLDGIDVTYVTGDAMNPGDIEKAFKGEKIDVVINALASPRENAVETFFEDAQRSISKWAAETGVKRVILHSSIGAGDSSGVLRADLPADSRRRYQDKEFAENIIRESGTDYAILRNYIIRPEGNPVTGHAFLSEDRTVTGSISRGDLAVLTLYCMYGPTCLNKTLHASTDDDWTIPPR